MTEILTYIVGLIKTGSESRISPKIGAIPPLGGVGIQQSSGSVTAPFLPRTGAIRETYVINAKNKNQKTALQTLEEIHRILTKRFGYQTTDSYQIATIKTLNLPDYLGQDNDESYMFGSSVEVIYYDRRKAEQPQEQSNE